MALFKDIKSKILVFIIVAEALFLGATAYAINITIPSAPGSGYYLVSTSTGAYTTTSAVVTSLNGATGTITGLNIYNATTTLSAGSGITVSNGGIGATTVTNNGVLSLTAGGNILISSATGTPVIAWNASVATSTITTVTSTTICFSGDTCRTTWPSGSSNTTTTLNGLSGAITLATSTTGQFFTISTSSNTATWNFPFRINTINNFATTTGGMIVATSSINGWALVPVGTNGKVWTASSTAPNGASWESVSATASPGGSDTQVQYNNGGTLAGDSSFTWASTTKQLALGAGGGSTNSTLDFQISGNSKFQAGVGATDNQFHLSVGSTLGTADILTATSSNLTITTSTINSLTLTGLNGLLKASNGLVANTVSTDYVSSTAAGAGITVSGSTGAVTITNNGVTSLVAGTDITVSSATGTVTVSNQFASSTWLKVANNLSDGVSSTMRTNLGYSAGAGLTLSSGTGGGAFVNNGVLSNVAGTGITVSSATGTVTIANNGVTSITASSSIGITNATGTVNIGAKNYPIQWVGTYATSSINTVASSSLIDDMFVFDTTSTIRNIWAKLRGGSGSTISFNLYYGTSTPSNNATTTGLTKVFTSDQTVVNTTSTLLTPNVVNACKGCFLEIYPFNASTTEFTLTSYYDQN